MYLCIPLYTKISFKMDLMQYIYFSLPQISKICQDILIYFVKGSVRYPLK